MSDTNPPTIHHLNTDYRLKGLEWSRIRSEPSRLYACDYNGNILQFHFNDRSNTPLTLSHTSMNPFGQPVRSIALIERKRLIFSGGDNLIVEMWDIGNDQNLSKRDMQFSHDDFVRRVVAHPKKPWIVSCGDDMSVHVRNYETNGFHLNLVDHTHYVLDVSLWFDEEKDLTLVATASLDTTVKLFSLEGNGSHKLLGTMSGHTKGVNCVGFVTKDIVVSGGDDFSIKIWNVNTFQCIATEELGQVVNACKVQKDLIFSCGESGFLFVHKLVILDSWNAKLETVYKIECKVERLWCLDVFWCNYSNQTTVAVGGDIGVEVIQLGRKRIFTCSDHNNQLTDISITCSTE